MSARMLLASAISKFALELTDAHSVGFTQSIPFQDSPGWHWRVAVQSIPFHDSPDWHWRVAQALPFQVSFGWQFEAPAGRGLVTQVPFFPANFPDGYSLQAPSLQIRRRRSPSAGAGSGSLHTPFGQVRRRRSGSGALLVFSFSFDGGVSPIRGDATIFTELPSGFSTGVTRPDPESGECVGNAVLSALPPEDDELEAGLLEKLGIGAGLGLLGALCVTLAAEGVLELLLDDTAADGPGVGLLEAALAGGLGDGLGELLVEECCADAAKENDKITATARLESRMTHLLPTERSEHTIALLSLTLPSKETIPRNHVKEGKELVENCHADCC